MSQIQLMQEQQRQKEMEEQQQRLQIPQQQQQQQQPQEEEKKKQQQQQQHQQQQQLQEQQQQQQPQQPPQPLRQEQLQQPQQQQQNQQQLLPPSSSSSSSPIIGTTIVLIPTSASSFFTSSTTTSTSSSTSSISSSSTSSLTDSFVSEEEALPPPASPSSSLPSEEESNGDSKDFNNNSVKDVLNPISIGASVVHNDGEEEENNSFGLAASDEEVLPLSSTPDSFIADIPTSPNQQLDKENYVKNKQGKNEEEKFTPDIEWNWGENENGEDSNIEGGSSSSSSSSSPSSSSTPHSSTFSISPSSALSLSSSSSSSSSITTYPDARSQHKWSEGVKPAEVHMRIKFDKQEKMWSKDFEKIGDKWKVLIRYQKKEEIDNPYLGVFLERTSFDSGEKNVQYCIIIYLKDGFSVEDEAYRQEKVHVFKNELSGKNWGSFSTKILWKKFVEDKQYQAKFLRENNCFTVKIWIEERKEKEEEE